MQISATISMATLCGAPMAASRWRSSGPTVSSVVCSVVLGSNDDFKERNQVYFELIRTLVGER